jgi:hypothetical protein
VRAKLPGCRYPGVAARRAQGGADAQVQPQLKLNRGDPIHYEFTLVSSGSLAPARQLARDCQLFVDCQLCVAELSRI